MYQNLEDILLFILQKKKKKNNLIKIKEDFNLCW